MQRLKIGIASIFLTGCANRAGLNNDIATSVATKISESVGGSKFNIVSDNIPIVVVTGLLFIIIKAIDVYKTKLLYRSHPHENK